MERLTTYRKDGRAAIANKDGASPLEQTMKIPAVIDRLAAFEDIGHEPEELVKAMEDCGDTVAENQWAIKLLNEIGGNIDRLRELAEADKDGRLVVLPCKVGDTVYKHWKVGGKTEIGSALVTGFEITKDGTNYCYRVKRFDRKETIKKFGKTVFLTRAEAEDALKGGTP